MPVTVAVYLPVGRTGSLGRSGPARLSWSSSTRTPAVFSCFTDCLVMCRSSVAIGVITSGCRETILRRRPTYARTSGVVLR